MEDMMTIHPYNNNEQQSSINHPDNQKVKYFQWTDTILPYKVSNLKAATVHAKRKYKGFTGTRYTWNGGVDNGIHASLTYYNIKRECERFRDFGINDLNLFSFLKIVDLKCKYNNIKDVNGIGNSMKRLSLGDIYFIQVTILKGTPLILTKRILKYPPLLISEKSLKYHFVTKRKYI